MRKKSEWLAAHLKLEFLGHFCGFQVVVDSIDLRSMLRETLLRMPSILSPQPFFTISYKCRDRFLSHI